MSNSYNGWTNYETWKIALELFDGFTADHDIDGAYVEAVADELVFVDGYNHANYSHTLAQIVLDQVNWDEIADAINERGIA